MNSIENIVVEGAAHSFPVGGCTELELYGCGRVVREYCGYPQDEPFYVMSTHGPSQWDYPQNYQVATKLPAALMSCERLARVWRTQTSVPVHVLRSPFSCYRHMRGLVPDTNASGTIYFWPHRGTYIYPDYEWKDIVATLESLPKLYKPITISLHFREVLDGLHHKLMALGYKCVTAGHWNDPFYIERFYGFLKEHRFAVSNQLTSALFYAVEFGMPATFISVHNSLDDSINRGDLSMPFGRLSRTSWKQHTQTQIATEMFRGLRDHNPSNLHEFVVAELGLDTGLSARDLLQVLTTARDTVQRSRCQVIAKKELKVYLVERFQGSFIRTAASRARRRIKKLLSPVAPKSIQSWPGEAEPPRRQGVDYDVLAKYLDELLVDGIEVGSKYTVNSTSTDIYSTAFWVLTKGLLGQMDDLSCVTRSRLVSYFQNRQADDGLFRDPALRNDMAETEDWWGWRHLAPLVCCALRYLNALPLRPFRWLSSYYSSGSTYKWLSGLDWAGKPDFMSNTVMNFGSLMQFNRDFFEIKEAGSSMSELFEFLDDTVTPSNGLWFEPKVTSANYRAVPNSLSRGVQTAYHLWILYFYDKRPIPFKDLAVKACLATQNAAGGFGVSLNSSACEDIDSIDPLCRLLANQNIQQEEKNNIYNCLEMARSWVPQNQMQDGGFVFKRNHPWTYGHPLLHSGKNEGNIFATWFRLLSLAYLDEANVVSTQRRWNWQDCPGYQFWHEKRSVLAEDTYL